MSIYKNSRIVGERDVRFLGIQVKERPDLLLKNMKNGYMENPVQVLCRWGIDGEEVYWPVEVSTGEHGKVWPTRAMWEKDEDNFRRYMLEEMEKLRHIRKEKGDNITGYG